MLHHKHLYELHLYDGKTRHGTWDARDSIFILNDTRTPFENLNVSLYKIFSFLEVNKPKGN